MGVLESPAKVLDFLSLKEWELCCMLLYIWFQCYCPAYLKVLQGRTSGINAAGVYMSIV